MRKRCQLIEEVKPDLVISIHQNSYHEEAIRGGQVFYYKTSVRGKKLAQILQERFDFVFKILFCCHLLTAQLFLELCLIVQYFFCIIC